MSTGAHPPVRLSTNSEVTPVAPSATPAIAPASIEAAVAAGLQSGVVALVEAFKAAPAGATPEATSAARSSLRLPLVSLVIVLALLGGVAVWRDGEQRSTNTELRAKIADFERADAELRAKIADFERADAENQAQATLRRLDSMQTAIDAIYEILRKIAPDAVAGASQAPPAAPPTHPPR